MFFVSIMLNFIRFLLVPFLFFFYYSQSYAAIQNFSGSYEGSVSGNSVSCTNTADDGPESSFFIILINQSANSFSGTISSPSGGSGALSGTIDSSGHYSGTFKSQSSSSGTISGSFNDRQMLGSFIDTVPAADGCLTTLSGTLNKTAGGVVGTTAQIQQSRQIVRTTNSLISQHLASEFSKAFSINHKQPFSEENSLGASSDQQSSSPLSFWGSTSLTEIHEDSGSIASFDTDIYQFVGGFDKKIGKFFVGSALTYAYGETEQTGQDTTTQVIGVTPYMAYQITDFMFISALGGYNYSYIKDENFNNDSDVHDYILESNLNFFKTFQDSIIIKARMGTRFHHTYVSSTNKPLDDSTDELMWLGDFELGYRFQNSLTTYVGTYYEYFDRESSTHYIKDHDGVLFMRGGFDYPIAHNLTIGGKVQADLNDEDTDIITGSINIRLAM